MNLDYLKAFYTTVNCNSISKASKLLHITQPALSMQIQHLENELNATLLIRSNKGVELTEEGKIVFDHAESMLSLEKSILKNLNELKKDKQLLNISACKYIGEYVLPCSIYTFKEIHPDIDVKLNVDNTTQIISKILNHEINLGVIAGINEIEDIISTPILSDKIVLITKEENIDIKSAADILRIPIILSEYDLDDSSILNLKLSKCGLSVSDLNIILTSNSPESIKSVVMSGKGFAFLPKITVKKELRKNLLKEIPIDDIDMSFKYYFAQRNDYVLQMHEQIFNSFITSKKRCFCY